MTCIVACIKDNQYSAVADSCVTAYNYNRQSKYQKIHEFGDIIFGSSGTIAFSQELKESIFDSILNHESVCSFEERLRFFRNCVKEVCELEYIKKNPKITEGIECILVDKKHKEMAIVVPSDFSIIPVEYSENGIQILSIGSGSQCLAGLEKYIHTNFDFADRSAFDITRTLMFCAEKIDGNTMKPFVFLEGYLDS